MLSFAAEFPVKEAQADAFIVAVQQWLLGSPHTSLDAEMLAMPSLGAWKMHRGSERLEALSARGVSEDTIAFKHSIFSAGLDWTTVVVYSRTPEDAWVSIRTARESDQPQISLPQAKKPLIVRTLLAELGGALDGELYVRDEPYYLADNDVGMATRLINADTDSYLPIVYVSRHFDGSLTVNPTPLARSLGGMAHVLVEPNRAFSRQLQRDVESRNVYGGRVGVHWPNGTHQSYYLNSDTPSEFDLRQALVRNLRLALLHRRPKSRCTWAHAEAQIARAALEDLRNSDSSTIEEYIQAFDAEMRAMSEELKLAEEEIVQLKSQLRNAERSRNSTSKWNFNVSEQELYSGEFNGVVKDALLDATSRIQPNSRRQDILSSIIESLDSSTSSNENREELKRLLRNYTTMDKSTRVGLEALGFSISEDGKHYKLVYHDDDRYTFALPKSGSDHRGGLNAASDIGKRLF